MVFRWGLETERGDEGNISKLVEWSVCTRNAGSNLNKRTTTSHLSAVCDAEGGGGGTLARQKYRPRTLFLHLSTVVVSSSFRRFVSSRLERGEFDRNELCDIKGFLHLRIGRRMDRGTRRLLEFFFITNSSYRFALNF